MAIHPDNVYNKEDELIGYFKKSEVSGPAAEESKALSNISSWYKLESGK